MDKFGEQCGREAVRELLGMDETTNNFLFENDKVQETLFTQM